MSDGQPIKRSQRLANKLQAADEQAHKNEAEKKTKDGFNVNSMLVLLYFSTAMVVLPLGIYFVIYWYIIKSTTLAALGAVVMVQLIVAAFVYKAWHDEKAEASLPSSHSSSSSSKAIHKKQS